jgi:hypothetical protein
MRHKGYEPYLEVSRPIYSQVRQWNRLVLTLMPGSAGDRCYERVDPVPIRIQATNSYRGFFIEKM